MRALSASELDTNRISLQILNFNVMVDLSHSLASSPMSISLTMTKPNILAFEHMLI